MCLSRSGRGSWVLGQATASQGQGPDQRHLCAHLSWAKVCSLTLTKLIFIWVLAAICTSFQRPKWHKKYLHRKKPTLGLSFFMTRSLFCYKRWLRKPPSEWLKLFNNQSFRSFCLPLGIPQNRSQYEKLGTTLESKLNAKLSEQRFWHCYETGLIKTIQMIPFNLYVHAKLTPLYCGLRLIRIYPNPQ